MFVFSVRLYQPGDADRIAQLFHDTVRSVNRQDYSLEQVKAWAPDDIYFRDWATIGVQDFTFVVEANQKVLGFAELELDGHIQMFYVHRDYQGLGIGKRLFQALLEVSIQRQFKRLYTEASITAKPFFEHRGFTTLAAQEVSCRGQLFINYAMEKLLCAPS